MQGSELTLRQGISEIVGAGQSGEGAACQVYRALRTLLCETCGVEIGEGELFTRWPLPGQKLNIMPRCRKCVPFQLKPGSGRKRESSALLDSLLAPQQETPAHPAATDSQKVAEAVEQRLGPALSRTRRSRKGGRPA